MGRTVPQNLREMVWNRYIGYGVGRAKCCCCQTTEITPFRFECGHVIAHAEDGETNVENLRPICASCNRSMGKHDMRTYMQKYGFGQLYDYVYDMEVDHN